MPREIFAIDVILRVIGCGSVNPGKITTDVSRSTKARVIRLMCREGYLQKSSHGSYTAGPNLEPFRSPVDEHEDVEGEDTPTEKVETDYIAMFGPLELVRDMKESRQQEETSDGSPSQGKDTHPLGKA